jgi:cell division protein ZapA
MSAHVRARAREQSRAACGKAVGRFPSAITISMRALGCYRASRMSGSPVELRVGGQTYRVVASAEEGELRRLAGIVDTKLRELTAPGRQISPQALLLAAIALAHDLEEERDRRERTETRWREKLRSVLERIDSALDATAVLEQQQHAAAEAPAQTDS